MSMPTLLHMYVHTYILYTYSLNHQPVSFDKRSLLLKSQISPSGPAIPVIVGQMVDKIKCHLCILEHSKIKGH